MTDRKPPGVGFGTWVEHKIREAAERGAFDNLPRAGKPIPDLDKPHDELWWIKRKLRDEGLAWLPPTIALRKEAEALGPGGRWTPWPPGHHGQAVEPAKSAMHDLAGRGRLRSRVGWRRLRLGVGHASTARPDPSTRGVVGERGSHREGRSRPVQGRS